MLCDGGGGWVMVVVTAYHIKKSNLEEVILIVAIKLVFC